MPGFNEVNVRRDPRGRFARWVSPSSKQVDRARHRLGLKLPVRIMRMSPRMEEGRRGGYAGVQRDALTGRPAHYVFLAAAPPGARNWALWHELAHALQFERGDKFTPSSAMSEAEYWVNGAEREAEMVADAFANFDLWDEHEDEPLDDVQLPGPQPSG